MLKPCVVDLSHWNVIPGNYEGALANLRLAKAEGGIQGLIHKATEGTGHADEKLKVRAKLAIDAGLLFGTYHFLRPGDMLKQADHYYDTVKSLTALQSAEWLWCCDYEDPAIELRDVAEFMGRLAMKLAPFPTPVLYTGFALKDKIAAGEPANLLTQYKLWLAHYNKDPVLPKGWDNYFLWQYTDKGSVPGIVAPTDLNAYDGTAEELRTEWTGRRGELPAERPPPVDVEHVDGTQSYTRTIRIKSSAPFSVEVIDEA